MKPWYQSVTILGIISTVVTPLVAKWGISDTQVSEVVASITTLISALIAIWGRYRANTIIGPKV